MDLGPYMVEAVLRGGAGAARPTSCEGGGGLRGLQPASERGVN